MPDSQVLTIIGTRPEAIKMAPVVLELERRGIAQRLAVTAQHRELLDGVLDHFGLSADTDLDLMQEGQTPDRVLSEAIPLLREEIEESGPELVLVHGDTITTLAGAFAAFFAGVPCGHVEAGLRSGDIQSPWPEEMSRTLTDRLCTLHFAPTEGARRNLLDEGIPERGIAVTGNTEIDAQRLVLESGEGAGLPEAVQDFIAAPGEKWLMTLHRRENWPVLTELFRAVRKAAEEVEAKVLYPVHPNPKVRGPAEEVLGGSERFTLTGALGFPVFTRAMDASDLLVTDSGGVQEAACGLGKPVVIVRQVTERPEVVEAGYGFIGSTEPEQLRERIAEVAELVTSGGFSPDANPFGDGRAAERIADRIERFLS